MIHITVEILMPSVG